MSSQVKNKNKQIIGVNNYVEHSLSILERIHELIDKKFDGKQIELAKKLGKKDSEISKWLNGVQNFTLFTISKLEEAFEERIIAVCTDSEDSTFVQVKVSPLTQHVRVEVNEEGKLNECATKYEDFQSNNFSGVLKSKVVLA